MYVIYTRSTKPVSSIPMAMIMQNNPPKNLSMNTTTQIQREYIVQQQPLVTPVIIVNNLQDCNSEAYQDNVLALWDDYRQKRVLYQAGINNNDPNVITLHQDMNVAYNKYYQEARKCNFFQG